MGRYDRAQKVFEAYALSVNNLTHDGKKIPAWVDLGDPVREAWANATETAESDLLTTVVWMVQQYLYRESDGVLDHQCMMAGEDACHILHEHDLAAMVSRGIYMWSEEGRKFLVDSL